MKSGEDTILEVEVGEELFFEVSFVPVDGFDIFLESCWMSQSAESTATIRHDIITDGCPLDDSVQFLHFDDHKERKFSVKPGYYIHSLPQVYLHCQAHVCNTLETNSRCSMGCLTRGGRRRRDVIPADVSLTASLSHGPMTTRARRDTDVHEAAAHTERSDLNQVTKLTIFAVAGCILVAAVAFVVVAIVVLPVKANKSIP
nr:ZP domain-containing protein-like [Lytechinus pictus]